MNGHQLGEALRSGRRVVGTCVLSTSPLWPAMIAQTGVDFVFIDTEHIPMDRAQLGWMCQAFAGHNLAPIVRIPEPNPYQACQVQDAGAAGVVAPYLETVAEVRQLCGAVKLRPLKGARLNRVLDQTAVLEPELAEYLAHFNEDRLCIANIESTPAMAALDEILAVPGLDALLIGPHDLSVSLGVAEQYDHPSFHDAVATIIRKGRAAGVGVGIHWSEDVDHLVAWAEDGLNLIIYSSDFSLVRQTLAADVRRLRTATGATPVADTRPSASKRSVDI